MIRILAIAAACAALGGCVTAGERAQQVNSERQDDATCRSFMKHKAADEDETYEECRQGLIDMANMPSLGVPTPSNVTIIVNQ